MRIDLGYGTFDDREHVAAVLRKALKAAAKAFVEVADVEGNYTATTAEVVVEHADSDEIHASSRNTYTYVPMRGPMAVTLRVAGHVNDPPSPDPTATAPEVGEST